MKKQIYILLMLSLFGFTRANAAAGDRYEGESYTEGSGVTAEAKNVGYIDDNDWIKYSSVPFDGTELGIDIMTSGKYDGIVEFRLDAVDGTLISTVALPGNGSWTNYHIIQGNIVSTTGTHDLYLVFTKGGFNIDYFQFSGILKSYTYRTSVSPANAGYIVKNVVSDTVSQGSVVTLAAQRKYGYKFKEWQNAAGVSQSTNNPYSLTVKSDTAVVAVFEAVEESAQLPAWTFDGEYVADAVNPTNYFPLVFAPSARPNIKGMNVLPDNFLNASGSQMVLNADTARLVLTGSKQTLRVLWTDPNEVNDFTVGTLHKQYCEFQFPTTGFKNISVDYSFSGGQSDVEDFVEMVYSVNNGANWIDAKQVNSADHWNTWVTDTTALANADGLSIVKVRLIGITTHTGANLNFNLDYFHVTGESVINALEYSQENENVIRTVQGMLEVSVKEPANVTVFSVLGKVIASKLVNSVDGFVLDPGIYIVKAGDKVAKVSIAK